VLSLLAGLAAVAAAHAQFPVQYAGTLGPQYSPEVSPAAETSPYVGPAWTVNGEYLLWFFKPAHFSTPVIGTTRDPNLDLGAAITGLGVNDPNFVNFVGPGNRDRGPYSGMRLTVTRALSLDLTQVVYTEVSGLWIPEQAVRRQIISNNGGNPAI